MSFGQVELALQQLLVHAAPQAVPGLLLAAALVGFSRLPLLSCAAAAAVCVFLGAYISIGEAGQEAGMSIAVAGLVAGAILLFSGGRLWKRPASRRRKPNVSGNEPGQPNPPVRAGQGVGFRLFSVLVVALTAYGLSSVAPLAHDPEEAFLGLWLLGMGMLAAFAPGGDAIVAATGYVTTLSAAMLAVPELAPDVTQQPMIFAAICGVIIIAALGFSFAAGVRPRLPVTAPAKRDGQV